MVRLVILGLVAFLLFITVLYLRNDKFDKTQRNKSYIYGVVFASVLSVGILLTDYYRYWRISEWLSHEKFSLISEDTYQADLDGFLVTVELKSAYRQSGNTVPRLLMAVEAPEPFENLNKLFCDDLEYQKYLKQDYGGWYPTPEIKLNNGRYVGKCYPQAIIQRVSLLPKRVNKFSPQNSRYLFLPDPGRGNLQTVSLYTEDLDINTLKVQLDDFLAFYQSITNY